MKYLAFVSTILLSSASFSMEPLEQDGPQQSLSSTIHLSRSPVAASADDLKLKYERLLIVNGVLELINEKFIKDEKSGLIAGIDFSMVRDQILANIHSHPHDHNLKIMLARLCFKLPPQYTSNMGLNIISQAIVHEIYDIKHRPSAQEDLTAFKEYCSEYMPKLGCVSVYYPSSNSLVPLSPLVENILKFINRTQHPNAAQKKIRSQKNRRKNLKGQSINCYTEKNFIEDCTNLFSLVFSSTKNASLADSNFDALLCFFGVYLGNTKDAQGRLLISQLSKALYDSLKSDSPSSLLLMYTATYLVPNKLQKEAFRLCKDIFFLKDKADLIPPCEYGIAGEDYNLFGNILMFHKKFKEASQAFGYAANLTKDIVTEWNSAVAKAFCGEVDDNSLETMKKILNLSSTEKKILSLSCSSRIQKLSYQFALRQAGKEDVLAEFLLAEHTKTIEKNLNEWQQKAKRIKQVQLAQELPAPAKTLSVKKEKKQAQDLEPAQVYEDAFSQDSLQRNEKKTEITPQKKVKIKTHGVPEQKIVITPLLKETLVPVSRLILYIENATDNKTAQKVFYKLFSKYKNDVLSDKNVKISIYEINLLFTALKQGFDPAGGKGSHKKGTLNFKEFGSEMEEQMLIFTKDTYLKPYQIKKLRLAFLNAGIIPNDEVIESKLKENFPDIFSM